MTNSTEIMGSSHIINPFSSVTEKGGLPSKTSLPFVLHSCSSLLLPALSESTPAESPLPWLKPKGIFSVILLDLSAASDTVDNDFIIWFL